MRFCECPTGCNMPVFGTDKKTKKGYCQKHQSLRTDLDKRSIVQKAMSKGEKNRMVRKIRPLQNSETNKLMINKAAVNFEALQQFFAEAAKILACDPRCVECNAFIPEKYYRAATAHIFPKAIFPSVATHPMNKLFLGAGCGCHNKSHRLDTFSKMGIWKDAVERFRIFEPFITEKHDYLNQFKELADATQAK